MKLKFKIHKGIIIGGIIILIIGISLLFTFAFHKDKEYQDNNKVIENLNNQNKVENKDLNIKEDTEEENDSESEENDITKDINSNDNSNVEKQITKKKNTTSGNSNNSNSNSNNSVTQNNNVPSENKVEKHTCTNEDTDYVVWKTNYLKENNSTRFFDSYDEAYNYGDTISLKYFYGFIVQTTPTTFNGNECTRKHYTMQLYVPAGICENNPMMYLPNNINLEESHLDTISYLKQVGYECAGKVQ